MARRKRQEDWIPITARVSVDSARRLRVTAARKGIPAGQVLDELIQAALEPDGPHTSGGKRPSPQTQSADSWTSEKLGRALRELEMSQSEFARQLGVAQKTVNTWILSGKIPSARQPELDRLMERLLKPKPR